MAVRVSFTVRLRQSLHNLIDAIPEWDWTPMPYRVDGATDVAETEYAPFGSASYTAPVRAVVWRVNPTPCPGAAFPPTAPAWRFR